MGALFFIPHGGLWSAYEETTEQTIGVLLFGICASCLIRSRRSLETTKDLRCLTHTAGLL